MSFLGGFLTPPPSKYSNSEETPGSSQQRPTTGGTDKSATSVYNALSGVKTMVSAYASTPKQEVTPSGQGPPRPPSQQEKKAKELQVTLQRVRLQSPDNHLGMLMAFSDKSLSPHLSEDFCFTWHRLRGGPGGSLEDIYHYNEVSMNANSWYPPTADDLGSVVLLHCEDTLGLGVSRQLESTPVRAEESFMQRVESIIEQNKLLERVVISSCNHRYGPPFRPFRSQASPSGAARNSRPSPSKLKEHDQSLHDNDEGEDEDEDEADAGFVSNSDNSSSSSEDCNITLPEFEVGGSIAINSEGILLRERGTRECGLHIDCTNYMSITCIHPASFVIELPLYYACADSEAGASSGGVPGANRSAGLTGDSDPLAPISSIRDLTSISTMRPSVEWLGEEEGAMYDSLQDVVNPDENPLEKSLEELGGGLQEQDYDMLFSSLRLQVACRDRATRDMLVLAIRSLAGCVLPVSSTPSGATDSHEQSVPQRLSLLPWRSIPSAVSDTTSVDRESAGCSQSTADQQQSIVSYRPGSANSEHDADNDTSTSTSTMGTPSANADNIMRDDRMRDLETAVEALTAEKIASQSLAESRLQEVETLKIQLEEATRDATEQRTAKEATEKGYITIEKDFIALSDELKASCRVVEALQQDVHALTAEKDEVASSAAAVQSDQDGKITELAELVKELEASRVEAAMALEAVQEQNFTLQASLEEFRNEGRHLSADIDKEELESLRLRCEEQMSLLKDSDVLIAELREKLLHDDGNTTDSASSQNNSAGAEPNADFDITTAHVAELRNLVDFFDMKHSHQHPNHDDHEELEGEENSALNFITLTEVIRAHISLLLSQKSDTSNKLRASEALVTSIQAEHKQFLSTLEERVQIISLEMTEKDEAHRKSSLSYMETIDGLTESVSILQAKIKKLEETKKVAEEHVSVLQAKCTALEDAAHNQSESDEDDTNNELQEELVKMTDECSKWHDECMRLKDVTISTQNLLKSKEESAATLKNDFDILSVRLQEVKQHNEMISKQSERDARAAKEKTDQLTYELKQASNTVKVMEARIEGLQSETLSLSDEHQVLKRQKSAFDSSKSQISQLRGQLVESDQTAQATRALLDETVASNERLKKEHKDMSYELANVNSLLAQKTSRIEELKDRIQVMDNEITSSDKVKSSFRKENSRLKEAAKKLKADSDTVKTLQPLYDQQLSKIADSHSRIVDLESALCDMSRVRNQYALTTSALEMRVGTLKQALRRRQLHSEREGMEGENLRSVSSLLMSKTVAYQDTISQLEADLSEAKMAEPFELKKLNFMVCKLSGEKNHYENKAKSLSKDLQRKLLAGTPLQRELGKMTARLEEVENERNAYRDAMVLACETYSTKEVSSWFG